MFDKPLLIGTIATAAVVMLPMESFSQPGQARAPWATAQYGYSSESQVPYIEARRTAYDSGYREGLKRGEQDARRGSRFSYEDEREFQRADKGFHRALGDRERYRQVFRDGFATGYRDGYTRISRTVRGGGRPGPYVQGRYGIGQYGYYSPAFENGTREGYEKGLEDARKHRSFDPVRHSWYRSGDRHYRSEYGSREQYKDVYRRGFQQGYERGFYEGRSRW